MISIENKALRYAKTKNLSFVVNKVTSVIECNCGTCPSKTQVKSLSTKVLYESEIDKSCFNVYEYQGVKVFILKDLKIKADIHIYQKLRPPFMSCTFGSKGIEV